MATVLAKRLNAMGHAIPQVFSRNMDHAHQLAEKVGAEAISQITDLKQNADVYFVCLKDEVVTELLEPVELGDKLAIHSSGTLPSDMLKIVSTNYGVFYPIQTFTKGSRVSLENVPVVIECSSVEGQELLTVIADALGLIPELVDQDKRAALHL
ncbi:MAG: NAD(P)-binding domain-containing protein, partial [Bacteroidetes bacterium]|nr:NAD(P)-binding domain-containing protein [Bacteroidota bacterium]